MSKKIVWNYHSWPADTDGQTHLVYFQIKVGDEAKDDHPYIYYVRTRDYNRHTKKWRIHDLEAILERLNFRTAAINGLGVRHSPLLTEEDVRVVGWTETPWPGGDQA